MSDTYKDKKTKLERWEIALIALKMVAKRKNISHQELADKTGLKRSNIYRLFRLDHCPNLDILFRICNALDLDVNFTDLNHEFNFKEINLDVLKELGL